MVQVSVRQNGGMGEEEEAKRPEEGGGKKEGEGDRQVMYDKCDTCENSPSPSPTLQHSCLHDLLRSAG